MLRWTDDINRMVANISQPFCQEGLGTSAGRHVDTLKKASDFLDTRIIYKSVKIVSQVQTMHRYLKSKLQRSHSWLSKSILNRLSIEIAHG